MLAPADRHVTETLRTYLEDAERYGRSWVLDSTPLVQRIEVIPEQWRHLAERGDLRDAVRKGIGRVLEDLPAHGDHVDRTLLTSCARRAGDSSEALVRCWFAVMVWGAGPQNRSRLRQWTRAVAGDDLVPTLEASRAALIAGEHSDAYKITSVLPGVGEAYLTKWLWVLGLDGGVPAPQPYILDNYVWQSLNRLAWRPEGPNRAERWLDFCRAAERWATQLGEQNPSWHIDGDRVEQLLFDRCRDGTHLYAWLGEQPS